MWRVQTQHLYMLEPRTKHVELPRHVFVALCIDYLTFVCSTQAINSYYGNLSIDHSYNLSDLLVMFSRKNAIRNKYWQEM